MRLIMSHVEIGKRYGKLVVISKHDQKGKYGAIKWNCICDCGNTSIPLGKNLLGETSKSCGCLRLKATLIHGMTKTRTFKSWDSMKQRCLNPNAPDYHRYGGRGITICQRWLDSFINFLEDMGERPENLSIDRINVNGNYNPLNCRWATRSLQQRNKSTSLMIEWNGKVLCAADWSDIVNISSKIICYRINKGWLPQDALTKPNRKAFK